MDGKDLKYKVFNATKWASVTEISAKLVSPITSMILARILAPEAFGVVTTITMITSFVDMFTDSGFQKYLVQHEFKSEVEKNKNANVAFWTNLTLSILFLGIIVLYREPIAVLVGSPGLGNVLAFASLQLPLTAFSSIQMSIFRRDFDFKTLFLVRMVSLILPIIITIPLALLGFSYWSLIIGTMAMQVSNALILTIKSKWKPQLFYSFKILKEMFSFSFWSLIEAVSIWLTVWVDVFIISSLLNEYVLGLYKTSITMVNTFMTLITATIMPILFSTLSRLQNNDSKFRDVFYKIQRLVAYFVLPMGFGVYLYSEFATQIMLGDQWMEASKIVGIWGLTSAIMLSTSRFNSEVYRSKGKPKLSFMSQMIHLGFLIPTCLISIKFGFWSFVYSRALIRFQSIITGFILMKFIMNFPIMSTLKNILRPLIFTVLMSVVALLLKQVSNTAIWNAISIFICVTFYISLFLFFAKDDTRFVKKLIGRKN